MKSVFLVFDFDDVDEKCFIVFQFYVLMGFYFTMMIKLFDDDEICLLMMKSVDERILFLDELSRSCPEQGDPSREASQAKRSVIINNK